MAAKYRELMLTPAVRAAQERYFGQRQFIPDGPTRDAFTDEEATFIAARDSFYMATINSDQWPYIQHRGGPPGFLKVLSPHLLGFADFKGNRQLLTTGNLDGNDRVALILMDYPHRERLKILGHARVLDAREHPDLARELTPTPDNLDQIERLILIETIAFDWNCPQHIPPRYTAAEIETLTAPLKARIAELEKLLASTAPQAR